MTAAKPLSTQNFLLNAFSNDALERLAHHLEKIDAPLGKSLYKSYETITYVYFPDTSMASIVANTEAGQSTEIGVVGCEGAVGLEIVMGGTASPHESMIQLAGGAHRIAANILREEFDTSADTRKLLLAFINKLMIQISQTTLCNRIHSVDERLARWLLMSQDRVMSDHLPLTQEFLAVMLGVSRVSVTLSAGNLQTVKYISYTRGNIIVLDREGLEDSACECYEIVKKEYDRKD